MDLNELRAEIDRADSEILRLFIERMEICSQVAQYKRKNNTPVFQSGREEEILDKIKNGSPDWLKNESVNLFRYIMKLSRGIQTRENALNISSEKNMPIEGSSSEMMIEPDVSVIIAAAGQSSRANGINKQLEVICGIPAVVRSMLVFEHTPRVAEIIVSARPEDVETIRKLADKYRIGKLAGIVPGGKTRQQSVFGAFAHTSKETRYIAVHDGARPLVSADSVSRCIKDASVFGAAALGTPVKDTLKTAEDGIITDTPDRNKFYHVQTPQIIRRDIYVKGINFANAHNLDFTDDCQLAESVGAKVCITLSDYRNIKITTPEDFAIAEVLAESGEK